MIKQRIGKCIDCEDIHDTKPLMAKRCTNAPYFHYQKYNAAKYQKNASERKSAKNNRISKANNSMTLSKWFAEQISQLPICCEECNEYLNQYAPWFAHCFIAHIVPKRLFESVAVHPVNRMFYCEQCHSKFDQSTSSEIINMKSWSIIKKRFNEFSSNITPNEIKSLQQCFYDLYMESVSQ